MNWESVTYAYISEPVEFRHLMGKPIDFRKTFDVRGQGPDELLQLYLQKAHLSNDVERLPAIQRRTYVYDIIRSRKGPGYWVPPCMQLDSDFFAQPPPAVLPPPKVRGSPGSERRYFSDGASLNMSLSSSSNSLSNFSSAPDAVPGPSFPTSVIVSNKGSKYEISGPVNFHHVSGDVTRDRTRNAFDLNGTNDNVLKKYMMERGIAEEDVAGIQRQELIKKIVHSNFTWMPPRKNTRSTAPKPPKLVYATISTNNQITPPPSPQPPAATTKQPPTAVSYSNYASLTSRFVDISDMEILGAQSSLTQEDVGSVISVQNAPPNRSKIPLPPSAVTVVSPHPYSTAIDVHTSQQKLSNETYATIAPQAQRKVASMRVPPPAPPKPTVVKSENKTTVQYTPTRQLAPPSAKTQMAPLQVCQKPRSTILVSDNGHIPPPAIVVAVASGVPPAPPPPPAMTPGSGAPAPPPPPMPPNPPPMVEAAQRLSIKKSAQPKPAVAVGDDRGAFLESIRKGVALKKTDRKAANIAVIKPRAEKKPPPMDFMSELKLGITLRRVKNPKDNPYSETNANSDESQV